MLNRTQALDAAARHIGQKFPDGRYGPDFQEALVDMLGELGVVEAPPAPAAPAAGPST